ncbi:MAG: hypothetical protein MMC33_005351 [Icmadophila ericetorum]|nr:hypothetical protein [Icmadophila ericetorum]
MNLVASAISKRIGLVKTMVFAHLPSTVFLALIPIPDSAALALVLLTLRYSFSSTDSAPRSAFVSAAVLPTERTRAMGIINIVKTSSQSLGPVLTGALSGARVFWIAFVVAGALKGLSDVGMLAMFWRHRTREELEESRAREGGSEPDDENHSVDRVE